MDGKKHREQTEESRQREKDRGEHIERKRERRGGGKHTYRGVETERRDIGGQTYKRRRDRDRRNK
jgi:hypothetical protein